MPLAEQIDEVGRSSLNELNRLRAYYEHTKSAWRLTQQLADEGRKIDISNPATNQILEAPEIYMLAQTYVAGYLAESVFDKSVSLFEDFLFGLLNAWLAAHPLGIPNKDRQLTFRVVFESPDKQSIIQHIIDKELDGLKYENISNWFTYLKGRVDLGVPSEGQIASLAEFKATRDIMVHNTGIVNDTYMRKAGAAARFKIGDRVEIREPYLYDSWSLVEGVFGDLTAAAISKARSASIIAQHSSRVIDC